MAVSSFLYLLLAVGSSAEIAAPSSQCAYLSYYFRYNGLPLLPSLVPSISNSCLAIYNVMSDPSAVCTAECQSLYSTYSQCFSPAAADNYASRTCGKSSANLYCRNLLQQDFALTSNLYGQCNSATYCNSSCVSAIAALEQFSGCCRSEALNGPKALCGQPTIAPCSTVFNNGSVSAPSRECAYIYGYLGPPDFSEDPSLTPSLSAACRSTLAKGGYQNSACIPECRSLYTLQETCGDVLDANFYSSTACGIFNNQTCLTKGYAGYSSIFQECTSSLTCSPGCANAIAQAEDYGGCCYAYYINGPKALCGQQPISDCSTIVNGGVNPTPTPTPQSGCSPATCLSILPLLFAVSVQALLR